MRFSYRSFASIVGVIALFVAAVVLLAGAAATLFLVAEERNTAALAAAVLSLIFSGVIAGMVPPVRATLYSGERAVLAIRQRSRFTFPFATYAVSAADSDIALVRSGVLSRLGRSRWRFAAPANGPRNGYAVEDSLASAFTRKALGKFDRKFQSNLVIKFEGDIAGYIVRRPDDRGEFDYLLLTGTTDLDHRVAIGIATLVFGSEP